jgi:flagellar protein FliJ
MKKFSFKLETLLNYRVNIEEKERETLSHLNFRLFTERNQLESLRMREQETRTELSRARAASMDDAEMQWFYPYLDRLQLEIERSRKRIAKVEKEVEAQKAVVIEATKNKKVLDTMKIKKVKEFTATIEKMEQKAVDEIMVIRSSRKES